MFIQTQETPNPLTLKFLPGIKIDLSGTHTFKKNEDASGSPLAQLLFDIEGIESIFFTEDFISITKNQDSDWEIVKPILLTTMIDYFVVGAPILIASSQHNSDSTGVESEVISQIRDILENKVQPAVAQDGGSIVFRSFTDGIVYVELQGACSGCPSSTITLKSGIENMLKHYVPEVISVESI